MSDVYEHNPEDHEDPAHGPTLLMGLLGVLLLTVTILGLTALYYGSKATEQSQAVVAVERAEVKDLRAEQEALLAGPARLVRRDEAGREVEALVIPVERAMEAVVREATAR